MKVREEQQIKIKGEVATPLRKRASRLHDRASAEDALSPVQDRCPEKPSAASVSSFGDLLLLDLTTCD